MKLPSLLSFLAFLSAFTLSLRAAPEYPHLGPDIYDTTASGAELIEAAIEKAKAEKKHVLLDLGTNWCPWCRKLHHTFQTAPEVKERLARDFVLVYIDMNMRRSPARNTDIDERYGRPLKQGIPVLIVLDSLGNHLVTQETGVLEEGDVHDPKKVAAFLDLWAPQRR